MNCSDDQQMNNWILATVLLISGQWSLRQTGLDGVCKKKKGVMLLIFQLQHEIRTPLSSEFSPTNTLFIYF